MPDLLHVVIRTPHEVVVDESVQAARVPTETGQVGLRPREEPFMLAFEPGLIILRLPSEVRFVATAGGLLQGDREGVALFTPFAITSAEAQEVLAALDVALAVPDSEISARRRLGELEQRIVREVGHRPAAPRVRRSHG